MLTPEDVQEKPNPKALPNFTASIRYEGVWFRYAEADVLKGIDLEIQKGETVALVGPSGGGKSTLVDLLPRFYDPFRGKITVDGHDLRDLRVADLRTKIGVVTQEGVLFNDTVLNNIAYGDAQPDRDRAMEAARIANAHDFIATMAEGYDTNIGERGTKLSGGQRQRMAIARAIYKNAPILILDEATSALDSESERLVQEALDQLTQNRTSIVIAHRLSTILEADRIYVIDEGRIVESGRHADLVARGGLYSHLYNIQFATSV
ncbi:MAG: ATP-binding cassette domain-containing protein [Bacteroidota bacterium]